MARKYTVELLDLLDQGVLDKDQLIRDLLMYMSEAEVEDFMDCYGYSNEDDD